MKLFETIFERLNYNGHRNTKLTSFALFMSITVIILLSIFYTQQISAQELNRFHISGVVKDQNTGRRLAGIRVEAINEADTTQRRTTISDATGVYALDITDIVTDVESIPGEGIPANFQLHQNYPNPFNPSTVISYQISEISQVRLVIYNVLGQKIKTLVDQKLEPGNYSTVWGATNEFGKRVSAGLYFYQLHAGGMVKTQKMVLIDGSVGVRLKSSSNIPIVVQQNSNLSKTKTVTVTLRATGAPIFPFEEKNIAISTQDFHRAIGVNVKANTKINTDLVIVSEPSDSGIVYISALAGTVIDTILGSEKITLVNTKTLEKISNRIDFDGGFLLTQFNASLGDEFSLTLFRDGVQLGKSEQIVVEFLKPPKVKKSSPTNGDKDIVIDIRIFIHFSEPINTSTVNENTFSLSNNGGNVAGTIGYLDDGTIATFTPNIPLTMLTDYTIKVDTGVKNRRGLHIENTYEANFSTGSGSFESKIAFVTFTGHVHVIYVMNSDGSNKKPLAAGLRPAWSPDDTRIFYAFPELGSPSNIFLMNSDGSFKENLTNRPDGFAEEPAISPDGTKIAFASFQDGNWEIYIVDINGTNPINLTNHYSTDSSPVWSPDGTKIAFLSDREGGGADIIIMERNGKNPVNMARTLALGLIYSVAWSPDGTKFAIIRNLNGINEIGIMNSDFSNLVILNTLNGLPPGVSWSADGTKLVFAIFNSNDQTAIAIINKDGSDLHYITSFGRGNYHAAWSPVLSKR